MPRFYRERQTDPPPGDGASRDRCETPSEGSRRQLTLAAAARCPTGNSAQRPSNLAPFYPTTPQRPVVRCPRGGSGSANFAANRRRTGAGDDILTRSAGRDLIQVWRVDFGDRQRSDGATPRSSRGESPDAKKIPSAADCGFGRPAGVLAGRPAARRGHATPPTRPKERRAASA